ncbi:MAG: COX15/CtaA family protein [Gemmatimonadetes bacterium]|nr:COX15/CtaA family protein [Gemmatimonadota bacterium]
MPIHIADPQPARTTPAPSTARRRAGTLSLIAAICAYALIVFGGIVRITGSGMGCGDDWPRCNGEWIPAFTLETLIEYTHRLLAAGIGLVVLTVLGYAWLQRAEPGVSGRAGMLRPVALATALLVIQALLGALTVRMELPTEVTVAHFVTALIFMAALIVAAVRGGAFGEAGAGGDLRDARLATAAAAIGFGVVAFGAVTANLPGAPAACTGFPLCSGALIPPPGALPAEIHWAHRVAAFALFALAASAAWATRRPPTSRRLRLAAFATAALIALQIGVAAALVLLRLPPSLQTLHLAVGAAVWCALIVQAAIARTGVAKSNPVT